MDSDGPPPEAVAGEAPVQPAAAEEGVEKKDAGEESPEKKESDALLQELRERANDDYEIIKPIGKGKFAVVYRARRLADNTIVAMKKITTNGMDEKAILKCLKEVRLLQSLHHPNIVAYLDSYIEGNELIIIFEWAESGDLKRQVRKAQERQVRFEERVIWKYFAQICEAIRHMHERRIMHRDLKPANIFLTLNGTVKVGDLGLGREMSEHTIEAHSKVGTPLYMSPEVLRGDGYDFRSDIWSVGCLLYELAMLKSPFKAEGLNLYSLFQKISKADYQPLPDHYSEELRELAYSMINIDPAGRPDINDVCTKANAMRQKTSQAAAQARRQQQQQQQQQRSGEEGAALEPARAPATAALDSGEGKYGDARRDSRMGRSESKDNEGGATRQSPQQQQQQQYPGQGQQGSLSPSERPRPRDGAARDRRSSEQEHYTAQEPQQQPQHISRVTRGSPERPGGVNTMVISPPDLKQPLQKEPQQQPQQQSGGQGGRGTLNGRPVSHVTLSAMEDLWFRLELTGYSDVRRGLVAGAGGDDDDDDDGEEPARLSPLLLTHFALPVESQGGAIVSTAQQFQDFIHVAHWLMSRLRLAPKYFDGRPRAVEMLAPTAVAQQLLVGIGAAQFPADRAADIKPAALAVGWGDAVIEVLAFLADQVLVVKQVGTRGADVWATPVYDDVMGTVGDDGDGDDAEVVDEDEVSVEEEGVVSTSGGERMFGNGGGDGAESSHAAEAIDRGLIPATVDEVAWRLELERVTPRLKSFAVGRGGTAAAGGTVSSSISNNAGSDWSIRLEAIRTHLEAYGTQGLVAPSADPSPSSRPSHALSPGQRSAVRSSSSSSSSSDSSRRTAADAASNVGRLASLGAAMGKGCEGLRRKEERLEAESSNLLLLSREHMDLALEGEAISRRMSMGREHRALSMSKLASLKEAIEELQEDVAERGRATTNMDPLVDIRGTITKLKSDIMEMDLRTGISSEAAWRRQALASSDRSRRRNREQSGELEGASALDENDDDDDDDDDEVEVATTSR